MCIFKYSNKVLPKLLRRWQPFNCLIVLRCYLCIEMALLGKTQLFITNYQLYITMDKGKNLYTLIITYVFYFQLIERWQLQFSIFSMYVDFTKLTKTNNCLFFIYKDGAVRQGTIIYCQLLTTYHYGWRKKTCIL